MLIVNCLTHCRRDKKKQLENWSKSLSLITELTEEERVLMFFMLTSELGVKPVRMMKAALRQLGHNIRVYIGIRHASE